MQDCKRCKGTGEIKTWESDMDCPDCSPRYKTDDEYWAEVAAEQEAAEEADRKWAEQIEKLALEWRLKWPRFCAACGGWGVSAVYCGSYYEPPSSDPCEERDLEVCHRCNEKGLDLDDGTGPCTWCGWDYDDGEPSW